MDYEKAYNDALERARQVRTTNIDESKKASEYIFPELREPEDERIIRTLKEIVNWGCAKNISVENNVELKDCLAWLEKQSEKLPVGFYYVNSEGKKFYSDTFKYGDIILHVENQSEQKSIDKGEPKFKVGDFILNGGITNKGEYEIFKILKVCSRWYDVENIYDGRQTMITFAQEHTCRLWTIQDAKLGDVLSNKEGAIFINAGSNGGGTLDCYCYLSVQNKFCVEEHKTGSWFYKDDTKPATKEQRDLLFQKMHEAGYEWYPAKKELKIKQEPSWNEEDKKMKSLIISTLTSMGTLNLERYHHMNLDEVKNWLESIKDRV